MDADASVGNGCRETFPKIGIEHLEKLLMPQENTANLQQLQALFGLVFEELPTYHDILNGTPKFSFVFHLSSHFHKGAG